MLVGAVRVEYGPSGAAADHMGHDGDGPAGVRRVVRGGGDGLRQGGGAADGAAVLHDCEMGEIHGNRPPLANFGREKGGRVFSSSRPGTVHMWSERQIAAVAHVLRAAGVRAGGGRSRGGLVLLLGLAVPEVDVVRQHLGAAAPVAVPVGPIPQLKPSVHHGHAALGKVAGYELGRAAPGHDVDEIGGLLAGSFVLEVPVAGDGERRDGEAGLGVTDCRIAHKAAHDGDMI